MFDFIRQHQRLMQFLLLLIIFPAFVLGFGLQSYSSFTEDPNQVAEVCGQSIGQGEFDQAWRNRIDRARAQLKENFSMEQFDTLQNRAELLNQLVTDRALACGVSKYRLMASPEKLRQAIRAETGMTEGAFDEQRYRAVLEQNRLTASGFENLLQQQLGKQILSTGVGASSWVSSSLSAKLAQELKQQRRVREALYLSRNYTSGLSPTEDSIRAYYQANQQEYRRNARLRAEYLIIDIDTIRQRVSVAPDELRAYYDQNLSKYGQAEERQARHILIKKTEDAKTAEAGHKKAEEVLKKAKEKGANFAALAKQYSEDTGSAVLGGSLGFFGRGAMVKPFEDKVFSMAKGEISSIVESDFGFHIILLEDIRPATHKPFETVRASIEKDLRDDKAKKQFAQASDEFTNIVYDQSDSLQPAAEKHGLKIQTSDWFEDSQPPAELQFPRLIKSLFADDAIKGKHNTPAIAMGLGKVGAARVLEYQAGGTRNLNEVYPLVRQKIIFQEARKLAKQAEEQQLAQLKQNMPSSASQLPSPFTEPRVLSRITPIPQISPSATQRIMSIPNASLPTLISVEHPDNVGYSLYWVEAVPENANIDKSVEAQLQQSLQTALGQSQGDAEFMAYLEGLKKIAKSQSYPERLPKKAEE